MHTNPHHPPLLSQDRPDLIISELSGLAFDSLQQAFRPVDLDTMFNQKAPPFMDSQVIYIAIDPAAGGPQSDYAMVSIVRYKGLVTVSASMVSYICTASLMLSTISSALCCPLRSHTWMQSSRKCWKNRVALWGHAGAGRPCTVITVPQNAADTTSHRSCGSACSRMKKRLRITVMFRHPRV